MNNKTEVISMADESTVLIRKCSICKTNLEIGLNNLDEAIYYNKTHYHSECFIEAAINKSKNSNKRVSEKWNNILKNISDIRLASEKRFETEIYKEKVFDFIRDNYGVTVVPTNLYTRLADIYSGKFKGMSKGIPPKYLLDMWKKQIRGLNKIADKNKTRGKYMDTSQRLVYDTAILINKYDSYLAWLEQKKIIEADTVCKAKKTSDINADVYMQAFNNSKKPLSDDTSCACAKDFSSIADEIFDD